ncbi:hypothetical protein FG386_003451 [Cryptosporidium ryanae]|uniref:uncharacterized protein n=1 Tax=Cryptosporidium ryanae TaxID=515981 RepID=UPI00351AA202|nr:hypothetical protein FG386_003451 [Cryptosporidium ryanae]
MRNKFISLLGALLLSVYTINAASAGFEGIIPGYISFWSNDLKKNILRRGLKLVSDQSIERDLFNDISLDNFEVTCVALLQRAVREFSSSSNKWESINLDSALELCTLINPWNSMECSGVTGVYASYARSIQEFVRTRSSSNGDLRAACLLSTAIAPSRPFSPLNKGLIKQKCEEACSGHLGKTVSKIDSSFCSPEMDLCKAVDFTLYSAFSNFTEKQFGIAVAVSILLSEGSIGIRTTFREGCRFILNLLQKGVFPSSSSSVSESLLHSSILEFYRAKLQEVGLVSNGSNEPYPNDLTILNVVVSQITDAIKGILDSSVEPKKLRSSADAGKPQPSIRISVSSEVSPISPESQTDDLSSFSNGPSEISEFRYSKKHNDKSKKLSRVQQEWFTSISFSIRKGARDFNPEFDEALTEAVINIDSSSVYSSCVSELKRSRLVSYRKISAACSKIDPFSNIKCQKLSHFELMYLIKVKDELESAKDGFIVDLRDLCNISNKMSLKSFIRGENLELSEMCVSALRGRSFKSKYNVSERSIRKVCERTDYFRYSACGEMAASYKLEKISLVHAIASNLFNKKDNKERLQLIRESDNKLPSYIDICNTVSMMQTETVEDCVFDLRDSLRMFSSISSLIDIESACMISIGGPGIYGGVYPGHKYEDRYYSQHGYYPSGYLSPYQSTVRRYYEDIESVPLVSSLPWSLSALPEELRYTGKYIRQQFSESRKGFYKDTNGKVVFHDGIRYRLNGFWFVKIGDDWYIDRSDAHDFVDIAPGDRRYQRFLAALYERVPSVPGVERPVPIYRRRGYDHYFGPGYPRPYHYPHLGYSYLQDLYGKPGTFPGQASAPFVYNRCKQCNTWTPYEHSHTTPGDGKGVELTIEEGPHFEGVNVVSTKTDYGFGGNIVQQTKTYHEDVNPDQTSNQRTVGTQTE